MRGRGRALCCVASSFLLELISWLAMAGGVVVSSGGGKDYPGKLTMFVLFACIVAATGGLIFGYDIGISGTAPSTVPAPLSDRDVFVFFCFFFTHGCCGGKRIEKWQSSSAPHLSLRPTLLCSRVLRIRQGIFSGAVHLPSGRETGRAWFKSVFLRMHTKLRYSPSFSLFSSCQILASPGRRIFPCITSPSFKILTLLVVVYVNDKEKIYIYIYIQDHSKRKK